MPMAHAGPWLSRRWYYTPLTHRAYSVRQVSTGDRRLLAEFALSVRLDELNRLLFDHVLAGGNDSSVGFAALESTGGGDRVIGVCAYSPAEDETARFSVAVAPAYRGEQVGRLLLSTLMRHAKRVGVSGLIGQMAWSNRPMQTLALSMGFRVEPDPGDRTLRRLVFTLR